MYFVFSVKDILNILFYVTIYILSRSIHYQNMHKIEHDNFIC